MKIGIVFGDNDFWVTITEFLELLKSKQISTKDDVVTLFNNTAHKLYWAKQNKGEYDLEWDAMSYLQIKKGNVLFDDEVDNFMQEIIEDGGNGEFFVLDTKKSTINTY